MDRRDRKAPFGDRPAQYSAPTDGGNTHEINLPDDVRPPVSRILGLTNGGGGGGGEEARRTADLLCSMSEILSSSEFKPHQYR